MRTFYHKFTRPDGTKIEVECSVNGRNSPATYSPYFGADGGDAAEFCIIKAWIEDTGEDVSLPDIERESYEEQLSATINPDELYYGD